MSEAMSPACPICGREIYSRRNKRCGYCGEPLPPELLLSKEEANEVAKTFQEIVEKQRREKEEEAKKQRQRDAGGGGFDGGYLGSGMF